MSRRDEIAYHLRREAQERAAGGAAIDPGVRRVHLDLADRHAARARSPQPPLVDEAAAAATSIAKPEDDRMPIGDRSAKAYNASILGGAAVGLIAGLFASFAMDRFQLAVMALSSSDGDLEPATEKTADRISKAVTGHALATFDKPLGGQLVHYALGGGLGVLYGIAAEYRRDVTAGYGTVFGIGVAALLDEAAVPALGLSVPPWKTDAGTHAYSLASHLVFGTIMECTRSHVRSMVGPKNLEVIGPAFNK